MDSVKKSRFRGKYKSSFCKWLRFNKKTYIAENDDDDDDWDNGNLINGNNPITVHRRQGLFKLFNIHLLPQN
jgi:hypothetical protein